MNTTRFARNIAIVSFLTLLGVLTFSKAAGAQESPNLIMRGPHGAFFVLDSDQPNQLPTLKEHPVGKKNLDYSTLFTPIVITRGPHGAGFVITQTGVGGPEGSGVYPGFPKLIMRGPHGAFALKP
jgi:hypothetical protein